MIYEIIISLVTSVLTWTILIFGKNVLIPFYEKLTYKGVNLSGTWTKTSTLHEKTDDETVYTESLIINQKASHIAGTYTVVSRFIFDNSQIISSYEIKGEIKDGYVILNASIADTKQIGYGAFVLKVVAGAHRLEGAVTLLNRIGDNIVAYSDCSYDKTI
jgi:hypothetical protein